VSQLSPHECDQLCRRSIFGTVQQQFHHTAVVCIGQVADQQYSKVDEGFFEQPQCVLAKNLGTSADVIVYKAVAEYTMQPWQLQQQRLNDRKWTETTIQWSNCNGDTE
jgi:hypothetical protein